MNQTSKRDKESKRDNGRQQDQSGGKTGLQQGANLGQKDAAQDKKSDAEIKRMGETGKDRD
jgi:hypothetical protein